MLAYMIRRLLLLPLIVLGVTILIFAMIQLLNPYQRASLYVKDATQLKDPKQLEKIIELEGLNDPIPLQYVRWLQKVFRGDLGYSETAKRPVLEALRTRFPATLELALYALLPLILGGIFLGVLAAVRHNQFVDQFTRFMSITGYAFPTFVLGLLLLMIFYAKLGWFPSGRLSDWAQCVVNNDSHCPFPSSVPFVRYTYMNTVDGLLNRRFDIFIDALKHLVLPVVTLSYVSWALLVRITRSSMLETLRQDYVTVARAKGQREFIVILKHAARNALIPVATISGLTFVGLLSGAVITETIFEYEGMGKFAAEAASQLDLAAVLGFTLFITALLVVMNLIVDLLYVFIDPRVKLE